MEIEITTTKAKLSKSIVNQIPFASKSDIITTSSLNGFVLGYLVNVVKDVPRCYLLKLSHGGYALLPANFVIKGNTVTRSSKGRTAVVRFSCDKRRELWIDAYKRIKATNTDQIFI